MNTSTSTARVLPNTMAKPSDQPSEQPNAVALVKPIAPMAIAANASEADVGKFIKAMRDYRRDLAEYERALRGDTKRRVDAGNSGNVATIRDVVLAEPKLRGDSLKKKLRPLVSAETRDMTISGIRSDQHNAMRACKRAGMLNEAGLAWLAAASE